MFSSTFEVMHRYFREYPEGIEQVFRGAGITSFPDVAAVNRTERRFDCALRVRTKSGDAFVLIFEALRGPTEDKLRRWSRYLTDLHDLRKVHVMLVVVCNDHATAEWASRPFTIGTDFWRSCVVRPLVLGPHNIPMPGGPVGEADLAPALLGVIAHGRDPRVVGVLEPFAATLYELDEADRVRIALEIQLALLEPTAARVWRNLMGFITVDLDAMRSHPVLGDVIRVVEARGRASAMAEYGVGELSTDERFE